MKRNIRAVELTIVCGSCGFIVVLAVSAVWQADIRWLHFVQAWMYIATIALALKQNRWGYFIGISAAGLWDLTNLVATSFFRNGLDALAASLRTGHLTRPDQLIAVFAWVSNLVVVAGCLWGYARLRTTASGDVARFVVAFAATTAFFAADMALFQPRYLSLFVRLVHPSQWLIY
ncbi:MAG TPA: hypothetical protein VGY48_30200 [Vicinamibacterales bacterium]|jgi:hypothetical protein|nr:hypothetical protein [Vicinamibacterales bacterium]